ncbi:alpha-1,4-fucosyltransferase [Marchantia polymorpha subsp. ruderalis]|uniref:Fucosyltransferase n=2 Tax=Marchantia polymorpha TaxID=3197 RepID=A0A176VIH0_MARPO|nr:hypothetical protein AXG93_3818s1090 [Marchantia polymorpha subsp. ruderalis]PTQ50440.1 hypothetical protein MARPO_0001s0410 [Marchantia polymorpha]BBM99359.1 hypothetical protein Mp_1g20750 [Marchantia polymorpha subsp. ruderalis]|eukprot:PTQ50440.1 hypothetical protein MARPO_0001s0410 [Marchantia polymorpha]
MGPFSLRRMVSPCVSIVLIFLVVFFIGASFMLGPEIELDAESFVNPARSVAVWFEKEGEFSNGLTDEDESGRRSIATTEPSFTNIVEAFHKWDGQVGCKAFRQGLPPLNRSVHLQDPNSVKCSELKQLHVSVLVKEYTWIPDALDNLYACNCGLTCLWTKSLVLADNPDANFYEMYKPPQKRRTGDPLRVYMDLEPARTRASQDLFVSYHAGDNLQATYAGTAFHMNRNHYISTQKNPDVLVYWSSSRCLKDRQDIARRFLPLVPYHSFGKCLNNVGGRDSLLEMYPRCLENGGGSSWFQSLHCAMSHYKFVLAIENTLTESYVTEKLFYALDSGAVPIYFGAPNVLDLVPPKSIILGSNYSSMEELAIYVKMLAVNPVLYAEYHAWRRCGVSGQYYHTRAVSLDTLPCRLCAAVSRLGGKNAQA